MLSPVLRLKGTAVLLQDPLDWSLLNDFYFRLSLLRQAIVKWCNLSTKYKSATENAMAEFYRNLGLENLLTRVILVLWIRTLRTLSHCPVFDTAPFKAQCCRPRGSGLSPPFCSLTGHLVKTLAFRLFWVSPSSGLYKYWQTLIYCSRFPIPPHIRTLSCRQHLCHSPTHFDSFMWSDVLRCTTLAKVQHISSVRSTIQIRIWVCWTFSSS